MGSVASQVSGPINPIPRRGQQTGRRQDGSFVPFHVAPGTVDTGNVPKNNCERCHNAQAPLQPQAPPQQAMYTYPTTRVVHISPGTVHAGQIIQPAPVTYIHPTAPMGQQMGYMGQPMGYMNQPMGYMNQPMACGGPTQPPPYMDSKGQMGNEIGAPPQQGYNELHTNNTGHEERAHSTAPPPYTEKAETSQTNQPPEPTANDHTPSVSEVEDLQTNAIDNTTPLTQQNHNTNATGDVERPSNPTIGQEEELVVRLPEVPDDEIGRTAPTSNTEAQQLMTV